METANAQNSIFSNRTIQRTTHFCESECRSKAVWAMPDTVKISEAKICKRAVFLPTHPHDTGTIDVSCEQIYFLI